MERDGGGGGRMEAGACIPNRQTNKCQNSADSRESCSAESPKYRLACHR